MIDVVKAFEPSYDLENTGEMNQVLKVLKNEDMARCIYDDRN